MNPFLHIDDFGTEGFRQLPSLLAVASTAKLWSPSFTLLEESKSMFGANDLLWLTENKFVSVTGREKWIFDKKFRDEHPWAGARWHKGFDDKLKAMANEDRNLPRSNRRVVIAKEEVGEEKAEHRLSLLDKPKLENRLRALYIDSMLPQGIQEKAERARKERRSVPRQILRDYFNHIEAIEESGADSMAAPDTLLLLVAKELGEKLPAYIREESLTVSEFKKSLEIVGSISNINSMKKFKAFLYSGHRQELQSMFFEYKGLGIELPQHVAKHLKTALSTDSLPMRMAGLNLGLPHGVLSVAGVIAGLVSYQADPSNPWGLGLTAIGLGLPILESIGVLPTEITDKKSAALVYIAHQRTRASRKELASLVKFLEDI